MRTIYCGPPVGLYLYGEFLKFLESRKDTFCYSRSTQDLRQSWDVGKVHVVYTFGRQRLGEVEIMASGEANEIDGVERLITSEAAARNLTGAGSSANFR